MIQHQRVIRHLICCDSLFSIGIGCGFDIGQHPDVGLAPVTLPLSGISRITDRAAVHKNILRRLAMGYGFRQLYVTPFTYRLFFYPM